MKTALVLACDDNFVPFVSVAARRAARMSAEKFPIIIISDGVSGENKKLAQEFCSAISFIEASHLFEGDFYTTATLTRATYLRLFLDEILADFDRVTYMDGDMTPLVDVSPLLRVKPTAAPVMACYSLGHGMWSSYESLPISRDAGYLQGGLQVFDLKAVRDERIFKDAIRFALDHREKCGLVDQDALNVVLNGRWQVLDWRWNVMNDDARHFPAPFYIRHHGGPSKPWSADKSKCEPHIIEKWKADLAESPWPHRFSPPQGGGFFRKYVRPTTRAVEVRMKAALRGDFDTVLKDDEEHRNIRRYAQNVPGMLKQIQEAAQDGRLAQALSPEGSSYRNRPVR